MSQPLNNLASVLSGRGYSNTLYRPEFELAHAERIDKISSNRPFDRVRLHKLTGKFGRLGTRAARLFRLSEEDRIAIDFFRKTRGSISEDLLIGYDEFGAAMAWVCSRLTKKPYLVFSLELNEHRRASRWERMAWRNANAVITFDPLRAEILEDQYGLKHGHCLCVPNSSIGNSYELSNDFFRSRLGIPKDKHVVLMVGSLRPEHGTYELMKAVMSWPERFALVMHGWGMDVEQQRTFDDIKGRCPDRLFLSTELLPQEDQPKIFASADIGIVAFTSKTINHRFAGASAGKLFDFCQAGKPVLANDLPGMRDLVERNSIGCVVEQFSGIGSTLEKVIAEQAAYKENCHRFFQRNEFGVKMSAVLDTLEL